MTPDNTYPDKARFCGLFYWENEHLLVKNRHLEHNNNEDTNRSRFFNSNRRGMRHARVSKGGCR